MKRTIYPLLPKAWHEEIRYYTEDEFSSKIIEDGSIKKVTSDLINLRYNADEFSPLDGQVVRGCDHLSAYIEAYMSLSYGVKSEQIVSGYRSIRERYENKVIGGINFGGLFEYFRLT